MKTKEKAFQMHKSGLSYKKIAGLLNISKTTAYEYVKEMKLLTKSGHQTSIQNDSEPKKNVRSDRPKNEEPKNDMPPTDATSKSKKPKVFTGNQLLKKKFVTLKFTGKFLQLIGNPSKLFNAIIWGLPKGGKSNFSIRFADYLHEYFDKVLYISAEEGESQTLQEKIRDINGSEMLIMESRDRDEIREYIKNSIVAFVFLDSINVAGIDNEFLELLKQENPEKSFISIVQATKGGNFKGDQALTHNCDFIIKVVEGVAYHTGRFNNAAEIKIFDEPLYEKNPNKIRMIETAPNVFSVAGTPIVNNDALGSLPETTIENIVEPTPIDVNSVEIPEQIKNSVAPLSFPVINNKPILAEKLPPAFKINPIVVKAIIDNLGTIALVGGAIAGTIWLFTDNKK